MTETTLDVRDFDPFDPAVAADPYPWYAALRRTAPVHHIERHDLWAVSRYDDVREVLMNAATFSNAAMAAAVRRPSDDIGEVPDAISIIGLDGDDHARVRRVVSRGFTPRRIEELTEFITRTTDDLLDEVSTPHDFDVVTGLAEPLPIRVIGEMLGVAASEQQDFGLWAEAMTRSVFGDEQTGVETDTASLLDEMNAWLDGVIEARLTAPGTDVISVLMRAEHDERLTAPEMRVFVFTLLVAGAFTTRHQISSTIVALIERPEVLHRVVRDPSRVGPCVEEALRYDSAAQWMLRTATRDTELGGTRVPAGATLLALIGSANRDESVFSNPDGFDLDRATNVHLAFGHGVHHCLGASLARLELQIAVRGLVGRTGELRASAPPARLDSFAFRGLRRLPIDISTPVDA